MAKRGRQHRPHPTAVSTAVKSVVSRYDAAGQGKRLAGWNPPSTGPNRALGGLQKIRDRARDAERNDWSAESSNQKWSTALIGIGIVPRLKRITDAVRKQVINDLWDDFVATSDADGVLNFYGQETLAVRSWLSGGEVFTRKRPRSLSAGLPVPLQVQLVESDFVPLFDTDTYPFLPAGNRIRQGIELDIRGQRVAYWMFKEHPGDGYINRIPNPTELIRVPASEVKHMFEPKRAGQLRGVSMLAPVLTKLRDIGNYQDAVLLRQQIANLFVAFLTRKAGPDDEVLDPLTGKSIEGTLDQPLAGLQPGLVQELEEGQNVTFANPPEAGTTYSDYLRTELMSVAAGSGLPYELFSGDIKEVSDRTLRVLVNEFRRFAEQRQWQIVIPMFCQPVRDWFADAALTAGKITVDEYDAVKRVEWAPQGWAYIHPVQDPQGKQIEVQAGFRSRSSVIGERGDDPEQVDRERAGDMQREEDLGLPVSGAAVQPADGSQQNEQDGIDNNEYGQTPNPTNLEVALEQRAQAERDLLKAQQRRIDNPPPPREPSTLEMEQSRVLGAALALLGQSDESEE